MFRNCWRSSCWAITSSNAPLTIPISDRPDNMPRTAMVLAAGVGERRRRLTERVPKPVVPVAGKPLLDHVLDRLAAQGVERAVVNVHSLAALIERHVASRKAPQIVISD